MRHVQRGISMTFLVIAILTIAVASTAGFFVFSQNLSEKIKSINSFEECAKHYPVMESYPEQCNTPEGKHFTKSLTKDEKVVMPSPSGAASELDGQVWNDVGQITILVNLFYFKHKRLPVSINEILSDPEWSYYKLKKNPVDNQPYVYTVDPGRKIFKVSGVQTNGEIFKQEIKVD